MAPRCKLILDQNVRGLERDEKKEELFMNLRSCNAYAATLQETWLKGNETLKHDHFTVVCSTELDSSRLLASPRSRSQRVEENDLRPPLGALSPLANTR